MWTRHAQAGCSLWLSSTEKDSFEGWHDGYKRLEDEVKHRRLIELDKEACHLVVEDTLEMAAAHEVELFFHCAEHCQVEETAGGYLLSRDGITVTLKLPPNGNARAGARQPRADAGLGVAQLPPALADRDHRRRAKLAAATQLRTEIRIERPKT